MTTAQEKFSRLVEYIRRYDDVAVAFSGGTKSALLVCAAQEAHGSRVWVLSANTPFFTKEELYRVHEVLDEHKVHSERVAMPELLDLPGLEDRKQRCEACGKAIVKRLADVSRGVGAAVLLIGNTAEKAQNPCMSSENSEAVKIVCPLIELGYTRQDTEKMLDAIGRGYYKRSANDCLARRFLGDDAITAGLLDFIENAEKYIRRYTRNELKVCADGERIIVYSADVLGGEARKDVRHKLAESGAGIETEKIEFFEIRHLEEDNQ